jgi:hypothetical protein
MPRSLPSRPSLEHVRKEAKRLLAAHRRGDASACEVIRRLRRFAGARDADVLAGDVSLQEVQHALSHEYGFRSWGKLRAFCSAVRSLPYSVDQGHCEPGHAAELQLTVTDVLGTSAAVRTGEQYLVRGQYVLAADSDIARIMLSGLGRNTGRPCPLTPGTGRFELTAELLEAQPGSERYLDILMAPRSGDVLGTRVRVVLEQGSTSDIKDT